MGDAVDGRADVVVEADVPIEGERSRAGCADRTVVVQSVTGQSKAAGVLRSDRLLRVGPWECRHARCEGDVAEAIFRAPRPLRDTPATPMVERPSGLVTTIDRMLRDSSSIGGGVANG